MGSGSNWCTQNGETLTAEVTWFSTAELPCMLGSPNTGKDAVKGVLNPLSRETSRGKGRSPGQGALSEALTGTPRM